MNHIWYQRAWCRGRHETTKYHILQRGKVTVTQYSSHLSRIPSFHGLKGEERALVIVETALPLRTKYFPCLMSGYKRWRTNALPQCTFLANMSSVSPKSTSMLIGVSFFSLLRYSLNGLLSNITRVHIENLGQGCYYTLATPVSRTWELPSCRKQNSTTGLSLTDSQKELWHFHNNLSLETRISLNGRIVMPITRL